MSIRLVARHRSRRTRQLIVKRYREAHLQRSLDPRPKTCIQPKPPARDPYPHDHGADARHGHKATAGLTLSGQLIELAAEILDRGIGCGPFLPDPADELAHRLREWSDLVVQQRGEEALRAITTLAGDDAVPSSRPGPDWLDSHPPRQKPAAPARLGLEPELLAGLDQYEAHTWPQSAYGMAS
ncbi:MAG: hypothetical protein AAF844_10410 [Pseudomonadota bacterium]